MFRERGGQLTKRTPSFSGWGREVKGDQAKQLETSQLPLPLQILLAALIEACHKERSQLQIAFINELQQLQPQPQPNGGDTSSQAVPSSDSEMPNALGLRGHFPQSRPQTLSWPYTLPSANTSGRMGAPHTSPGCFSQPSLKFTPQSRPNSCCCSLR